jgi:hypothetical protein
MGKGIENDGQAAGHMFYFLFRLIDLIVLQRCECDCNKCCLETNSNKRTQFNWKKNVSLDCVDMGWSIPSENNIQWWTTQNI